MDKLAYSILWLLGLLWLTGWAAKQEGIWWDVAFGLLVVACVIQLGLICYNASDVMSRRRMWNKLKGKPHRGEP